MRNGAPSVRIKDAEIQRFRLGPDAFEFSLSIAKAFEYQEDNADGKNKKWARAFEDFEETLVEKLKASAVKYTLVRYWVDIRDEIIRRSQNQRFLTWVEYEALCREYDETPDVELAMLYLRDISGAVLHYPQNALLKDKVFIDANWINRRIYAVLNYEVKKQHGYFDFEHVKTVLNVPEAEAQEMIALMLEFELIFEDARQSGHYIAPQYLLHQPQAGFESARHFANLSPVLTLRFPNFLPRSVLARFIARVGFHAVPNQFWKFGILFQQGLSALVECFYDDVPRIEIAIQKGEEKVRKALAKDIFESVLEIMEGEGDFEISVEGSAFVPYQEIKKAYAIKAEEVLSIDNQPLDRSLFDVVKPKTIVSKQRVFLSYAREDSAMKDRLEKHLSNLKRSGKIATWQDGEILPGAYWDEKIKQELHNADIILFLISADFIASDYIWNTEVPIAWERHKRREAVVIPILLRPCDVTELEFMKLQVLPKGLKPVSSFDDSEEAFSQIAMEIRRVVDARISQQEIRF